MKSCDEWCIVGLLVYLHCRDGLNKNCVNDALREVARMGLMPVSVPLVPDPASLIAWPFEAASLMGFIGAVELVSKGKWKPCTGQIATLYRVIRSCETDEIADFVNKLQVLENREVTS